MLRLYVPIDYMLKIKGEINFRAFLSGLESELDPEIFWRIHRSTIINSNLIERIGRIPKKSDFLARNIEN